MHTKIQALINGRRMTFAIEPEHVPAFEAFTQKSAYEILRTFTHGTWKVDDISKVLNFATFSDGKKKWFGDVPHGFGGISHFGKGNEHINTTLRTCPPGNYAELATAILTAALFGVKDGENTFTDEPDGA